MNAVLRLIKVLVKLAVFFTLFAFALNNQQDTVVHFFFGQQWRAPQVLVVLSVFSLGVAVGVLGMLPLWRRRRHTASPTREPLNTKADNAAPALPAYADGI